MQFGFNSISKILIFSSLVVGLCGFGYLEKPPELGKPIEDSNVKPVSDISPKSEPVTQPDLTPSKIDPAYQHKLQNRGKYSEYLKDMDYVIQSLQGMEPILKNFDMEQTQVFAAKAVVFSYYINYLNEKYANKTELKYASFKNVIKLNDNLTSTADYLSYANKYRKLVRGSLKDRKTDQKIINEKVAKSLLLIKQTIEILKENSR